MTKHDDRKRRVRARMAKTGESYTTARARLAASTGAGLAGSRSSRSARGQNELSTIDLVVGLPTSRELVAAVQQARLSASAAGDITPIHLLAALAHTAPSIAHDALVEAGVDLARLRALAVTSTDDDVAVADTDVKMSVSSRSAFEHARAAHPGWVARRYGVEPDDRRDSWRPMRTGHLLLGLLDQGSILAIVPELATPALRESVLRLLQGDLELPPPWSLNPKFRALRPAMRDLLAELDDDALEEPRVLGASVFAALERELNALPRLRWEGNLLPIWAAAKRALRSRLDTLETTDLEALQPADLDALLQEIVAATPTVIRARRLSASSGADG